jgi:hypothetical protein
MDTLASQYLWFDARPSVSAPRHFRRSVPPCRPTAGAGAWFASSSLPGTAKTGLEVTALVTM